MYQYELKRAASEAGKYEEVFSSKQSCANHQKNVMRRIWIAWLPACFITVSACAEGTVYTAAEITARNAECVSEQSRAVIIEGMNSVTLENVTIEGIQ